MKRSIVASATFAAFLSLVGCAGDPIAPGEERGPVGATETTAAWESVRTSLGGEACAKTITDSIRHNEGDGEIAITWWRAACGNVQCSGRIVGRVDLKEAASEEGLCSDGTRTLSFSDTL